MQIASPKRQPNGFSLSELMIAIAILSVLVGFTISKVLVQNSGDVKEATLRDTISSLSVIQQKGMLVGQLTPDNSWGYFSQHLNAVHVCETDSLAEGCWTHDAPTPDERLKPGLVLHNGVTMAGLDNDPAENDQGDGSWGDTVMIDWNGADAPNQIGEDQISIVISFGTDGYVWPLPGGRTVEPGSIEPNATHPEAVTLYNELFSSS